MFAPLLLTVLAQIAPPPTPPPLATPTPAPTETASPAPSPLPSGTPAPSPSPSPSPFGYVVTPSPAPSGDPQIVQIALNDQVQHEGGDFRLRVTTSPDVFQLQLRTMGRILAIPQAGPGLFAAQQRIPTGIPFFFLNRWYNVDIIATGQEGRSTTATISVRLER